MLKNDILRWLAHKHGPVLDFWTKGGDMPEATVEAHCDLVYTIFMLGDIDQVPAESVNRFLSFLRGKNLPGWKAESADRAILVHNCAYAFGALNLLSSNPAPLYDAVLAGRQPYLDAIVDPQTRRPVFPPKWAHHNWRVSHWIGGIPSILLSLARSGTKDSEQYAGLLAEVRSATDGLLDARTGLIKAYRSALVQKAFRTLYVVRHDPELGDVGGVAHILWVDHAMDRPYLGLQSLLAKSQRLFRGHPKFMEGVPYCLDFDIVQIVRTALEQTGADRSKDVGRARRMMSDIDTFFTADLPPSYTLHKVPGALATYHECALIAGAPVVEATGTEAIDIVKRAYWL